MAGFFYQRTIRIERAAHQASDTPGYGGIDAAQMTEIASGVACSIQSRGTAQPNPAALPGDSRPGSWRIGIAKGLIAPGVIKDRDFITDDLGRRFQVRQDYVHAMGWRLMCDRLE